MNVLMGARPMFGAGRFTGAGIGTGGLGFLGLLAFLLVSAVVIGLIVWLVLGRRSASGSATSVASASDTALAIARERLARGELDPEQYVAILDALRGRTVAPVSDAIPEG